MFRIGMLLARAGKLIHAHARDWPSHARNRLMKSPPNGPELLEMKCRNCGADLSPEDISPQLAAARCRHCHTLFAIPAAGGRRIERPQVSLPKGFTIDETMDTLDITRRWRSPVVWFILFFAVLWNGFMVVWNGIAFTQGAWPMAVFGLLHTGVGLFLIYTVIAMFVNSTVVRSAPGLLAVKSGPLPWKGDKTMDPRLVEQLFCREKISRGKNGTTTTYQLEAVLEGNRRETLVKDLSDPDHALYIEQQLERHLRLPDVPVAGEHGR